MSVLRSSSLAAAWILAAAFVAVAQDSTAEPSGEPPAASAEASATAQPASAGQPGAAGEVKPAEAGSAAASPAGDAGEFDRLFGQWKDLLNRMREMRLEFRSAKPDRRAALRSEYEKLSAQGDSLLADLTRAGTAAYLAAPEGNPELVNFLAGVAYWQIGTDRYEEAHDLTGQLIEKNFKSNRIYDSAAVAAFMAGDLGKAEQYLAKARELQVVQPDTERILGDLEYYKEAWPKEQAKREAEAKANDLPRVVLKTTAGEIEVELFENEAPNTVANFISLVEKGFYNGLAFHRVLPGFMAQGGDPAGNGSGGPGYTIPDEIGNPEHRLHFRGSLSMAKTAAPDSGGSQFFLNFAPTRHLDGVHTVFGRVIKGMDVLAKIARVDPDDPDAAPPTKIVKAEVLRKREHEYKPETLPDKG